MKLNESVLCVFIGVVLYDVFISYVKFVFQFDILLSILIYSCTILFVLVVLIKKEEKKKNVKHKK